MDNKNKIKNLIKKGVKIPAPESILISEEVNIDNISCEGVILYPGTKIFGKKTFIHKNTIVGYESPVTIDNCQIGSSVKLNGGFFKNSVFLDKTAFGSGSHVREGTIFEEEASIAHNVGLKQTILFPFATLGSLINFCDCFLSGGTSRKDHSEVGSSYIHFNYTPNQDKATPSLFGDVAKGVMLNQSPIFLGGQGGVVGPCRLNFGTVSAAGTIVRNDEFDENRLIFGGGMKLRNIKTNPGVYTTVDRIVVNNINYIANLIALKKWYMKVRSLFICDNFPVNLQEGLAEKAEIAINERIKRVCIFCEKMGESIDILTESGKGKALTNSIEKQKELFKKKDEIKELLTNLSHEIKGDTKSFERFGSSLFSGINDFGKNYIKVIQNLSDENKNLGTNWLQGIVDEVSSKTLQIIPLIKDNTKRKI